MTFRIVTGLAATLLLILGACQIAPRKTEQEQYADAGARKLLAGKVKQLYQDKTWVGEANWAMFLGADGTKAVKTSDGATLESRWYMKDGVLCEESVGDGRETCAPRVYQLGNEYKAFDDDGSSLGAFTVVDGNSMGL